MNVSILVKFAMFHPCVLWKQSNRMKEAFNQTHSNLSIYALHIFQTDAHTICISIHSIFILVYVGRQVYVYNMCILYSFAFFMSEKGIKRLKVFFVIMSDKKCFKQVQLNMPQWHLKSKKIIFTQKKSSSHETRHLKETISQDFCLSFFITLLLPVLLGGPIYFFEF